MWGLYDTRQQIDWESTEGRVAGVQWAGWAYTLLLLPFACGGAVWLRRRGGPWGLLTAMLAMVTVTAALTYGNERFRIAAEPALAVLAAVGAMALLSWWSARRRGEPATASGSGSGDGPTEQGRPRNDRLEGLRAIAALSVMGTHLGFASGLTFRSHFGAYFARMDIGVAIFFVLSGYLLYRPFIRADLEDRRSPHLGAYFWRRTLRIVPAYWVALAAIPIVLGIDKIRTLGDLVIYGGFLQIYDQGRALGGITQAWSLCTELSFYLALPVYAWLVRRYAAPAHLVAPRRAGRPVSRVGALPHLALRRRAIGGHDRLGVVAGQRRPVRPRHGGGARRDGIRPSPPAGHDP